VSEKLNGDYASGMSSESIISVIIPTYDRPDILSQCLESLSLQSSRKFEVVVVYNGSTARTFEVVESFRELLPSLRTVTFVENIWSWTDITIYYSTVYQRGMHNSKGDFLLFLSDDDALAWDFVERAIQALSSDANCVAFTGSPIDRDLNTGIDVEPDYAVHNRNRPRLEDGVRLALRYFSLDRNDNCDLGDPGFGYVIRSDLYKDPALQHLIWNCDYETSQYFALIPNGMVAFDPEAKFYWGRHANQANRLMDARIGMLRSLELMHDREKDLAIPFWRERFGPELADSLEKRLRGKSGFRSLKFLWRTHGYDRNVVWDLGRIIRNPGKILEVARTDGREFIFWILFPRACLVILKRLLNRLRTSLM